MTERQTKIVITSAHKRPGITRIEETKNEATGTYRFEGGTHVLEYEEYLEEAPSGGQAGNGNTAAGKPGTGSDTWQGGVATYNLVEIEPSEMRVTRKGSIDSSLRFKQGTEHKSDYKTPFGAMKSRVHTTRYAFYTLEKGNRLIAEAEYTVSMNGMEMSETTMRIDATLLPEKR